MPAKPDVPLGEIVNALIRWRGNVAAVASALGIRRKNLYERIERGHLELAGFRRIEPGKVEAMTRMPPMPRPAGDMTRLHVAVPKPSPAPVTLGGRRPNLAGMESRVEPAEIPIRTAPRRESPIRVAPPQREQLQSAAWELQARYGVPTDVNLILEQFIDEEFASWLASKLQTDAAPATKRGREGDE